jgi:hypothetical protein
MWRAPRLYQSEPVRSFVNPLQDPMTLRVASIVIIVVLGVAFAWVGNRPARIAALGEGRRSFVDLESEARTELGPAIARTLFFLLLLFALDQASRWPGLRLGGLVFDVFNVSLTTALTLDIVAEWRARVAMPDLIAVWPEHRPYALAVAREALTKAGIPVHARGERVRRLLQCIGPCMPIELMVRRADAEQAAEILAQVLPPRTGDERVAAGRAKMSRAGATRSTAALGETCLFAALSLLMVVGLLLLPTPRLANAPTPLNAARVTAAARGQVEAVP